MDRLVRAGIHPSIRPRAVWDNGEPAYGRSVGRAPVLRYDTRDANLVLRISLGEGGRDGGLSERKEALEAAYESAKDRMRLTREGFMETFCGWQVRPVKVRGKVVGAVLIGGNQIHACIKPEGFKRWLTKGVLQDTLWAVLAKHGRAITSVAKDNEIGHTFVAGLGFKPVSEADGVTWYEVKSGH